MDEYEEFGEKRIQINDDFRNVVIVDNIPVVGDKKYEKLCKVIERIFGKHGKIAKDGFQMPKLDGKTQGYCFIEFESAKDAATAQEQGDNKKLDKDHKLRVTRWNEFDNYIDASEEYEAPEEPEFESNNNLTSWLLDHYGRDQFVIRYGNETQIFWNDPHRMANNEGRVLQYGGERETDRGKIWTESYTAWSSKGSYLATFHRQGIKVWGGDDFQSMGRIIHSDVNIIAWSPNEKYIVTSNGKDRKGPKDPNWCIQIWDIKTQKMMRGFDKAMTRSWPAFKWSHDDRFFARTGDGVISIYETPHMGLLDKKSVKVDGVRQIEWSPKQNVLAYWVPEQKNVPAKVALIEVPSRKLIREKHLYSVDNVKMHWQSNGDYLCVKMARKKTKKTIVQNFEIFRLKDKNVPIEVLEIEDEVLAFSWEPNGHRFALIHGNPARPDVSFYKLKKKSLEKIKTLENRCANCVFWSPTGDYVVLAGLGDKNGQLDFVDTNDWTTTMSTEHIMCTDVEWDPSGRFVLTSVTQPIDVDQHNFRATMENGYKMWTCSGQLLQTVSADQFYQVLWRPRPATLLTNVQKREIKNGIKDKYWKQFEAEDDEIRQSQLSGEARERENWKQAWKAFRSKATEEHANNAPDRAELRGCLSDDEGDFVETEVVTAEEISKEQTYI